MSSNSKIKERIISITRKKFYAFGFKKTTMNEIASDSGISKTTLYEYFDSKEKLVEEISQIAINEMKKLIEDLHNELTEEKFLDLISSLKKVIHFAGNKFAGANPAFEEDIRKSAPNIFAEIQDLDDKLREVVRLILKYGVDNGLIRKDISLRVAVEVIMNISINLLVSSNNGYHAFFSESEIYDTTTKIILNGLLTDKGKNILGSMDNNSIEGTNKITTDPHHFDDK